MKEKSKSPAAGRRIGAQGVAMKQITITDGKVRKPKGVCMSDVIAFITNANAREFKIINSVIRKGAV
jgi:hypothetical protein